MRVTICGAEEVSEYEKSGVELETLKANDEHIRTDLIWAQQKSE
jgi:hypothetical protein